MCEVPVRDFGDKTHISKEDDENHISYMHKISELIFVF